MLNQEVVAPVTGAGRPSGLGVEGLMSERPGVPRAGARAVGVPGTGHAGPRPLRKVTVNPQATRSYGFVKDQARRRELMTEVIRERTEFDWRF